MTIRRSQVALNAIQWINFKPGPGEARRWLYADPSWRNEQLHVHEQIRAAGFDAVMMEVLDTQTLQSYKQMLDHAGLRAAPGYIQIAPAELKGQTPKRGSAEWIRWFDSVRRRAEESNFLGLDTVFLAPEMDFQGPRVTEAAATGAFFSQDALDLQVEYLAEAAKVLKQEGIRAGLHNHVGTLIETAYEIEYALSQIDESLLGASLDVGHLAWAGIDYLAFIEKHSSRLIDLHLKDLDLDIATASRSSATPYYEVSDQRFFLEPGLGNLDLGGILKAVGEDFGGWVIVEVDRASMDPFESAQFSWKWIEAKFPA
ncbi:sugar phosphate isomerase/epimerase family protein [Pseudarthrobacter sp. LMD1-1-1.1]|uniref:sugar phosphate isomerase/epimerase family protein n=1 Tax=Pseudarthrobacter sp. LMD1-1-1.1 TaxID=3135242 RepID=UPI003420DFFD